MAAGQVVTKFSQRMKSSLPLVERVIARVGESRGKPVDLYHEIHGNGPHKILFITGWAGSCENWKFQTDFFRNNPDFQVCIYENRGSGFSSAPYSNYSMRDMAEDANDIISHLGWNRVHVVGVSMGGMVAQELADLAPTRISSLTLGSTSAGRALPPAKHIPWLTTAFTKIALGLSEVKDKMPFMLYSQRWLNAPYPSNEYSSNLDHMLNFHGGRIKDRPPQSFTAAIAQLSGIIRHHVSSTRLRQLGQKLQNAPSLVIHGTEDALVHLRSAYTLSRDLHAGLAVFEGRGHAMNHEDPEIFNRLLLRQFYTGETGSASEGAKLSGWDRIMASSDGIDKSSTLHMQVPAAAAAVMESFGANAGVTAAMLVARARVIAGKAGKVANEIEEAVKAWASDIAAKASVIRRGMSGSGVPHSAEAAVTAELEAFLVSNLLKLAHEIKDKAKKLAELAKLPEDEAVKTAAERLEWVPPFLQRTK